MILLFTIFGIGYGDLTCGEATELTHWCTSLNGTVKTTDTESTCTDNEQNVIGISYAFCGRNNTDGTDFTNLKFLDFRSDPSKPCPYPNQTIGDLYGAKKLETL